VFIKVEDVNAATLSQHKSKVLPSPSGIEDYNTLNKWNENNQPKEHQ
jgi:hypothetical protein